MTLAQPPPEKSARFLRHLEPLEGALLAYCRRSLRNRNDVADVLQSAIGNAFRDFDLYAEGTNFRAWMFRYVSYEVLNRNRAFAREREVDLTCDPPDREPLAIRLPDDAMDRLLEEPEFILDECDEALSAAVLELPHLERNILLLRGIGDFKYREIAGILDVPVGTVMGLLSRSRERLRQRLLEYATNRGLLPRKQDP